MNIISNLRDQVMDPKTSEERISSITSFLTCGYEVGGDNENTIERFFSHMISQIDEFLQPLSDEEKEALPNGVMRRLTDARNEAEAYAEKVRKEASRYVNDTPCSDCENPSYVACRRCGCL